MKAHTTTETKEIPFGYKLVGHRYEDIDISLRELQHALKQQKDPDTVWRYLTHLMVTLKPK